MTSLLPVAAVVAIAVSTSLIRHSIVPLGVGVVLLPFLLQRAEIEWQRHRPAPIRLDRTGMWFGDELRIRWTDIAKVEIAPGDDHGEAPVLKVALAAPRRLPRSLVWRLGLQPGDGGFDFYLRDEYGVPLERIATVLDELRRRMTGAPAVGGYFVPAASATTA